MFKHEITIAIGLCLSILCRPIDAFAERSIEEEVDAYYGGEATAAYLVLGMSAVQIAAGGVLVTRSSDFARGLGWPLLTLGALELIGAIFYAIEVAGQLDHYRGLLASDPQAFQKEELDHVTGTTSRFVIYRAVELGLVVAGVGLTIAGAVSEENLITGIGIGVAAVALPIFVIDTFNYRRAGAYRDRLSNFRPSVALDVRDDRWTIGVGGTF